MKHFNSIPGRIFIVIILHLLFFKPASAQTDMDAIMIPKNYFCTGVMYTHNSWKDYWEGTFKRNNLNLGTVSSQMYGVVANYGITKDLNVMANVPYVTTKASAGTLKGMKGVQDLSFTIKYRVLQTKIGTGKLSVFALGGLTMPVTNYVADFLPLSIGMHSKNGWIRGMVDYQLGGFFVTASGVYTRRSNIKIDRTAYYTDAMHYTNEVQMPDMAGYDARVGFRNRNWIAEAVVDNFRTLGGFDIRKNDMPFPSNMMDGTRVGGNLKYSFKAIKGLEATAGGNYIVQGRNIGQSTTIYGGVLYLMNFSKKKTNKS